MRKKTQAGRGTGKSGSSGRGRASTRTSGGSRHETTGRSQRTSSWDDYDKSTAPRERRRSEESDEPRPRRDRDSREGDAPRFTAGKKTSRGGFSSDKPTRYSRSAGPADERRGSRFQKDESAERPYKSRADRDSGERGAERPYGRPSRQPREDVERPQRRSRAEESDRPFRSGRSDREPRESGQRGFGRSRSEQQDAPRGYRKEESDRPYRSRKTDFDAAEPKGRKSFGSSRDQEDRPQRRSRQEDSERPYTSRRAGQESDDRPQRRSRQEDSDRPYSSRRAGQESEDRPQRRSRQEDSDRPYTSRRTGQESESSGEKRSYGRGKTEDDQPRGRTSSRGGSAYSRRPDRDDRHAHFEAKRSKGFFDRKDKPQRKRNASQGDPLESEIRLNRFLAMSGIGSRRQVDELITAGLVSVNGNLVTELGTKVKPGDDVRYNGERIRNEKLVYILLNKPKDYITTAEDPDARKTVMELIEGACKERVYPVGRLDRNTTGLLLFTNDGDLARYLTHPSSRVKKIYHVEVDKNVKVADMRRLTEGVELEDGISRVDDISFEGDGLDKKSVGVELHSGKNRVVRRLFEALGYDVRKLDRVAFAGLTKKDLPRGRWRRLEEKEIGFLKMMGTGKKKKEREAEAE